MSNEKRWLLWADEADGAPRETRVVTAASAEEAVELAAREEAERFGEPIEAMPKAEAVVHVALFAPRTIRLRVSPAGVIETEEVPRG